MSDSAAKQLQLAPLGAGDLIDRAVRLYRRHLFVLIRIAAPPVIIVAAGWILLSISIRRVFVTTETSDLVLYVVLMLLSVGLMLAGYLFMLIVMGGATRTLVAHLLRNEPVTARATYIAVKTRFWGLLGASFLVLLWITISLSVVWVASYLVLLIMMLLVFLTAMIANWLTVIVVVLGILAAAAVGTWLFFFIAGRVAYVPQ